MISREAQYAKKVIHLLIYSKTDYRERAVFFKTKQMDPKKLINFSEVSLVLTGNKNTIRANRDNIQYSSEIEELVVFMNGWVSRNSKYKEAAVSIKTIK